MARIMFISAATHRPPSEIARHSDYELLIWEYALRDMKAKDEDRYWEKFGRHMGTVWYRSDFESKGGAKPSHNPDVLFYPHATLTSPNNIFKMIKTGFEGTKSKIAGGEYVPQSGEEIVDTGEMSYEDFKSFFKDFSSGMTGA